MSHPEATKIPPRHATTDRSARREDLRKRNIRRRAVEVNELRFALAEAGTLRHFERALASA